MSKSPFAQRLASLSIGDEVASLDGAVRYAIFHGVQGQFTPASKLSEKMHERLSRKFLGRAAIAMLTEGLQDHAVPSGAQYKKKPGMKGLPIEQADDLAQKIAGLQPRVAELSKALAEKKATKGLHE